MKNIILINILIYFCFYTNAQNTENIVIGTKVTIYSKVLNENRKIWIYAPTNTSPAVVPDKRYPVLYLLDGDAHFFSTVGIIQQLSQANGNGVLPEMIVVAIENTNRLRDLTPRLPPIDNMENSNPFVKFLSSELIPFIEKNFNTAPYKVLVGHSLGGLTAIDIMANFPQIFNSYIAIDPSLWYNGEKYLNSYLDKLPVQNLQGHKLFIGTANTAPKGMSLDKIKTDQTAETQHIRSILKFDKFLNTVIKNSKLVYSQKYYNNDRHNTVPLISAYDGLRFVFEYYFFDANEKDFADSTMLIATRLKSHYLKVSEELGYQVSPPEVLINYLGYDALGKKHFDKADALFKMNVENYPESSNTYDSYGDFFVAKGDTAKAIDNYKKALQIKIDANTLIKLNALTKQESFQLPPDELKKYAGIYVLETYSIDIVLEVLDGKIFAKVPGQDDSEFVPVSKDIFTVKGKQGYTITFSMNGEKPNGFTSVQPNGIFKAVFKNE